MRGGPKACSRLPKLPMLGLLGLSGSCEFQTPHSLGDVLAKFNFQGLFSSSVHGTCLGAVCGAFAVDILSPCPGLGIRRVGRVAR